MPHSHPDVPAIIQLLSGASDAPFHVSPDGYSVVDDTGAVIARCTPANTTTAAALRAKGNVLLMAAAPKLALMLLEVLAEDDGEGPPADLLDATIAYVPRNMSVVQ